MQLLLVQPESWLLSRLLHVASVLLLLRKANEDTTFCPHFRVFCWKADAMVTHLATKKNKNKDQSSLMNGVRQTRRLTAANAAIALRINLTKCLKHCSVWLGLFFIHIKSTFKEKGRASLGVRVQRALRLLARGEIRGRSEAWWDHLSQCLSSFLGFSLNSF